MTCQRFLLAFTAFSLAFLSSIPRVQAVIASPSVIASQYSLATSTSIPFPAATASNADTQTFLVADWSLSKGRIQNGADEIAFVDNPFPDASATTGSNSSGPVFQVTYPASSFSQTGITQLYSLFNASNTLQSMMISYEVAFDANFDWVKGGKLPGLRGGPNATGCSGGNEPTGTDCFSARIMWRKNGVGEGAYSTTAVRIDCFECLF